MSQGASDSRAGVSARRVVGVFAIVVILVLGVLAGAVLMGVLGAPSVRETTSRFGPVDAGETTVLTRVEVSNPNPITIVRENATIAHRVRLNGLRVASGTREGVRLPPGRSSRVIETTVDNAMIPRWWSTHVRRGERTTVGLDARVRSSVFGRVATISRTRTIETDVLGEFNSSATRPIEAPSSLQSIRSGPVLFVNRTNATWGPATGSVTPIEATFEVYNPLSVPIPITNLAYDVSMNNVSVGSGATERTRVLQPGRVTTVEARIPIETDRLDEWWVTHIERGERTTVEVDFSVRVRVPTVGVVEIPADRFDYTTRFATDLLGANGTSGPDATNARIEPVNRAASPRRYSANWPAGPVADERSG